MKHKVILLMLCFVAGIYASSGLYRARLDALRVEQEISSLRTELGEIQGRISYYERLKKDVEDKYDKQMEDLKILWDRELENEKDEGRIKALRDEWGALAKEKINYIMTGGRVDLLYQDRELLNSGQRKLESKQKGLSLIRGEELKWKNILLFSWIVGFVSIVLILKQLLAFKRDSSKPGGQ